MSSHPYKDTGEKIKEVRSRIPGYTQKQLAKDIGLSDNYVAMLERGDRKLTDGVAYRIAKECGVSSDYLLLRSKVPYASGPIDISSEHNKSIAFISLFEYICQKSGYEFESVGFIPEEIPDDLKSRIVCKIKRGSSDIPISSRAINNYFDDVIDYAEYKLRQMLEKEGSHNG